MKEFGKRLIIILSFPLWIVIHFIYLFIFIYILGPVGFVVAPLSYLFIGRELYFDWWVDRFDRTFEKHIDFVKKIERL